MARRRRPRLAVWKFSSCDGCQLSLLDLEDELLALTEAFDIEYFKEATSIARPGPYDVSLVEGSVTTPDEAQRIRAIRADSRVLVTIGACATSGGIQALRNFADVTEYTRLVYARPEYIKTLATSTGIAEHVPVDYELRGCPVDKHQLLEVVSAFLHGRKPNVAAHSVCLDCKLKGNVCVMVTGTPCLGPVTHAGCNALCPSYARGCFGCFGPSPGANIPALSQALEGHGVAKDALQRMYRSFTAHAPEFEAEHRRLAGDEGAGEETP